ncbi:hypothetical protein B0H66DRAFT_274016 [Apodospora peruviana]|uniref:Uncharacterized protein n=1 Tax=Apodospora peruviana TaxID=516989 RepID=A0AAE0HZR0_9PEZI|nr:hypothetical protein B0H66DRAFT_274016 [Apodospora peruviana]
MKSHKGAFAAFGLIFAGGLVDADPYPAQPLPTLTMGQPHGARAPQATPTPAPSKRQEQTPSNKPGEVGVAPLPKESLKASLREGHTKYLTELEGTTSWVGPDPTWLEVKTSTINDKVVTATQGVSVIKNPEGGLSALFSKGVMTKLKSILAEVTPCGGARRRRVGLGKRGGACGLPDFIERVNADPELSETFSEQFTDQVWGEMVDEGLGGDPGGIGTGEIQPGWEGEGVPEDVYHGGPAHEDEGFYEDESGWFDAAPEGEGEGAVEMVETIVFGTAEEAAAIEGAAAAGGAVAVEAGGTATAGSFIAVIYKALEGAKGGAKEEIRPEDLLVGIPKENIHKIHKEKNKGDDKQKTSTSSSEESCPTQTEMPECGGKGCSPTSSADPKATDFVHWACSEGDTKGCPCNPAVDTTIDLFSWTNQLAMWSALDAAHDREVKPRFKCAEGNASPVASKYFGAVSKAFCSKHFNRDQESGTGVVFDIHGNEIPHRRRARSIGTRSPPEKGPEAYEAYQFQLRWTPSDMGGKCRGVDEQNLCQDAFDQLQNSQCGINHGSPNDRLWAEAAADVNCGEVGWKVNKEAENIPPPPPGPQKDIYIMWEDSLGARRWNVFAIENGGGMDPCKHDAISNQGFGTKQDFPPNLGEKFSAFGIDGMTFSTSGKKGGKDSGSGGIVIPGRDVNVECRMDPEEGKTHHCVGVAFTRSVVCSWQ